MNCYNQVVSVTLWSSCISLLTRRTLDKKPHTRTLFSKCLKVSKTKVRLTCSSCAVPVYSLHPTALQPYILKECICAKYFFHFTTKTMMERHLKSVRNCNWSADINIIIPIPKRIATLLQSIDTVLLQFKMKSKLKHHKGENTKFLNPTDESQSGWSWRINIEPRAPPTAVETVCAPRALISTSRG